jgi:SAM-dependent methyltransferase
MTQQPSEADAAAEFTGRVLEIMNDGALTLMMSLGHRAGLFDAMATLGSATSQGIADAAGLHERYVREWLAALVAGRIIDYAPADKTYLLPPQRAACLTRAAGPDNLAAVAQFIPLLGEVEGPILECFRKGGGLPYSAYPRFHAIMAEDSAAIHDCSLIEGILPLLDGLPAQLDRGINVLDVGCGRGHSVNLMAKAYPRSRFTGVDTAQDAIVAARDEARVMALDNVTHEVKDAAKLEQVGEYELVTAFDAIHDLAEPERVLSGVAQALRPGGRFLMVDLAASSNLENNLDHFVGPLLYAISCMHCTSVSLGAGGPGLGNMWGEELASQMLADAGFVDVRIERMPGDPFNNYYVASKGG